MYRRSITERDTICIKAISWIASVNPDERGNTPHPLYQYLRLSGRN
jgi:hypothetical protein